MGDDPTPRPHWSNQPRPPVEFVDVEPDPLPYSECYRDAISIDVIHDGDVIPDDYLVDGNGVPFDREVVRAAFIRERDWGASVVAARLSKRLGLSRFLKVTTARCLLDFGRFPGVTRPGAPHLRRSAINAPFAGRLRFSQSRRLLEEHYDAISDGMDRVIRGRLLKIAIHTYDKMNPSGTERPQVSIVSRTLGYQMDGELPYGVFDPLYPDILAEFTVDRILPSRLSLTLERQGVPVAHNYPYLLPEGSPEVRHQVWSFFDWLEAHFQAVHPDTEEDLAYQMVWRMLKDTNMRQGEAGTLRAYIHRFRRPPADYAQAYSAAEDAYRHIERFLRANNDAVVHEYRFGADRPMSFGIEVRKDLIHELAPDGTPLRLVPERAERIADGIADAIITYLQEDRVALDISDPALERTGRWYGPGGEPNK
jgi:hypothetical protein